MPEKFLEWFRINYSIDPEILWNTDRDLFAGAMARYLLEKGRQIGESRKFTSFKDYFDWLRVGVEWTS